MGLADIAAGVEVTDEQRDRGVATVEDTDAGLAERLGAYAADLPCTPEAAATVLEAYVAGQSVGAAAAEAGVAPITAAKTLHLLGERVAPLGPTGMAVIRDWLDAELSRSEALALAGAGGAEFALAAFVETHEPLSGAREAVEGALIPDLEQPLEETMSGVGDLRES